MFIIRLILTIVFFTNYAASQNVDKFKQLDQEIATPNLYRTASGYPGHGYWQNRADYTIDVKLNDDNQSINGFETITYTNKCAYMHVYILMGDINQIIAIIKDPWATSVLDSVKCRLLFVNCSFVNCQSLSF